MRKSLPVLLEGFKNPTDEHLKQAKSLLAISGLQTDSEIAVWNFIVPQLALKGWLSPSNVFQLADLCYVWVEMEKLKALVREHGYTYSSETRDGFQMKNRPEVGQLNELARRFNSYAGSFGLNPAAEKQLVEFQTDLFKAQGDSSNPYEVLESLGNNYGDSGKYTLN